MSSMLKHPESASEWARFAHDEMFPARVGVFEWNGVTVVFDNNPQPLQPDAQKDRLARAVNTLRDHSIEPEVGWSKAEHDGRPYTWAVVVPGSHAIAMNRSLWADSAMRTFFREESIEVINRALAGLVADKPHQHFGPDYDRVNPSN